MSDAKMKPKISIITLGVSDMERAIDFYRDGLGLPEYVFEGGNITFFALEGSWLALYPWDELAEDIGVEPGEKLGFGGFTLAHNVGSKEEVDVLLDQAVAAGAALVKPAQEAFWGGYSGYFRDPDGHCWEIAYNPYQDLT